MRFEFQLPGGGELAVGVDHGGFFASVGRETSRDEYDQLTDQYDQARPLDALLRWLVARGTFSEDDLDEALLAYADADDGELSPGATLALKIVEALKRAAAE
jgi:hypothetical protein